MRLKFQNYICNKVSAKSMILASARFTVLCPARYRTVESASVSNFSTHTNSGLCQSKCHQQNRFLFSLERLVGAQAHHYSLCETVLARTVGEPMISLVAALRGS